MEIKLFLNQTNIESIVFYRSFFGLLIIISILILKKYRIKNLVTKNLKVHILRSIAGTLAMISGYLALNYVSLVHATTLGFTKIFFVIFLAHIVFKEKLSYFSLSFAFLGFVGICMSLNPSDFVEIYGTFLCIISSVFVSLGIMSVSFLSKKEKSISILFYHAFLSSLVTYIAFYNSIEILSSTNFFAIFIICVTALLGQYFNIVSYRDGKTSKIVIIGYSRIVFSFLLGYFILNETINLLQFFGLIVVIFSTLAAVLVDKKNLKGKDKDFPD